MVAPPPEQPWSPFPVQDWSALPHDPLQPVEPSGPRRRWWPPLIIFVVIGTLIGSAAYLTSRPARPSVSAAQRYLPADGSAAYERVETTRETTTTEQRQVTDSARLHGVTAYLAENNAFGLRIFADLDNAAVESLDLWRTISTVIGEPELAQTTSVYRITDDVALLGESGPSGALVFSPALVELPATVAPGSTWSGSGSASEVLNYQSSFRAEQGDGECLRTSGELRLTTKDGKPSTIIGLDRTWCPGEGLVSSSSSAAPTRVVTTRIDRPDMPVPTTTTAPPTWPAPDQWQQRAIEVVSKDPNFGEGLMTGSTSAVPPTVTASGLVVRAIANANDLVAFRENSPTQWATVWQAHAPGTILTVTSFGDVVVVTTSERAVIGYSADGVRLWRFDLSELPSSPTRYSDTSMVLADLSGTVRMISLIDGAVVWQAEVGADVRLAPGTADGQVLVMDRGGTVTALDGAGGHELWTRDLAGSGAAAIDGVVVILQDQTAHGLDPATGATLWRKPFFGTLSVITSFGDRLVIGTKNETVLLDRTGAVTARLPDAISATIAADQLVLWGADEAVMIDRSGSVVTRWSLPPLSLALQTRPAVPRSDGVLLFGSDWPFQGWSR